MWRPPKLEKPTVFIAAPGDLKYLRDAAVNELNDLRTRVADDHGIDVYDWIVDKVEDGFKDWIPAQGQIPDPADPNCRAVICMLGERLGTPLPDEFPDDKLARYKISRPFGGYHLCHPWEGDAVDKGGFSLTGSVYEFLAALQANDSTVNAKDIARGDPPVLLLIIGDETVKDEEETIYANWGLRRLEASAEAAYRKQYGNRWRSPYRRWISTRYEPQLKQLRNFLGFVERQGIVPRIVDGEENARIEIRDFLVRELDLRDLEAERDPFKGLDFYETDDRTVFFGREAERQQAISELGELWNDRNRPTFFGFVGGSGVGKSSMLRAGLVSHLCHRTSYGNYCACVVRPAELLLAAHAGELEDVSNRDGNLVLQRLFAIALQSIDAATNRAGAAQAPAADDARLQPERAVAMLEQAIEGEGQTPDLRLLIGFDQFEEFIDQWSDPKTAQSWVPVARFIALAADSRRIGVLYTMQLNRGDLVSQDPTFGPLWDRGAVQSLGFPGQSLEPIIRQPFAIKGLQLEPALVRGIRERIQAFADPIGGARSQASLLPLISLTLRRLYEARGIPLLERPPEASDKTVDDTAAEGLGGGEEATGDSVAPVLSLAECAGLLDVGEAISELATKAMAEAEKASGPEWSKDILGNFLRRLVRLSGPDDERLHLPFAPVPRSGALRHLALAMMRYRLLVPESGERMHLVHEAVLRHWSEAAAWLDEEQELLDLALEVGIQARKWDKQGRDRELLRESQVDPVAGLLANWIDVFCPTDQETLQPTDALIRDYGLALMKSRPTPSRTIESSKNKNAHTHIAAIYADADLIRQYIALDAACVHAERSDKRTPIFGPTFFGAIDIVDQLVAAGAAVDHRDNENWQPIHIAAALGQLPCLVRYLECGVAANSPGGVEGSTTPLHLAARNGHTRIVEHLLRDTTLSTTDIDLADSFGTPLFYAANKGHSAVVTMLLDRGAATDLAFRYGWTALHQAAHHGRLEITHALLARGAATAVQLRNGWTPLHKAASEGHAQLIKILVDAGADVDARANDDWPTTAVLDKQGAKYQWKKQEWSSLHLAVGKGHVDVVAALINCGADVDGKTKDEQTALHIAAAQGDQTLARLLADVASPQSGDNKIPSPFQLALQGDHYNVARVLVEKRHADVNGRDISGRPYLHSLVVAGKVSRVRFLLDQGADIDLLDDDGSTPLHRAAERGRDAALRVLLENNAGVDLPNRAGLTALHLAARAGHVGVTVQLIKNGADPGRPDGYGWMPLHLAAQNGRTDIVQLLLQHAADVDAVSTNPALTPLQAASETGQTDVVKLLIRNQANVRATTDDKAVPLLLAVKNAQYETALALSDADADTAGADGSLPAKLSEQLGHNWSTRETVGEMATQAELEFVAKSLKHGMALPDRIVRFIVRQSTVTAVDSPRTKDGNSLQPEGWLGSFRWSLSDTSFAKRLASQVNPIDGKYVVVPTQTSIDHSEVPWLENVRLIRVKDKAWEKDNLTIYYLMAERQHLFRLNGTSPPIHEINKRAKIAISEHNVVDYLKFFCFFVRGDEGPFQIVETMDNQVFPDDIDPSARKVVAGAVRPVTYEGRSADGKFLCDGIVIYSNAIFIANFAVHPTGMVDMLHDEPIAGNLPFKISTPIA